MYAVARSSKVARRAIVMVAAVPCAHLYDIQQKGV